MQIFPSFASSLLSKVWSPLNHKLLLGLRGCLALRPPGAYDYPSFAYQQNLQKRAS